MIYQVVFIFPNNQRYSSKECTLSFNIEADDISSAYSLSVVMINEHIKNSDEYMCLIEDDLNTDFFRNHTKQFEEYIKSIDTEIDITLLNEVYSCNSKSFIPCSYIYNVQSHMYNFIIANFEQYILEKLNVEELHILLNTIKFIQTGHDE
jgi:hypothetical protein